MTNPSHAALSRAVLATILAAAVCPWPSDIHAQEPARQTPLESQADAQRLEAERKRLEEERKALERQKEDDRKALQRQKQQLADTQAKIDAAQGKLDKEKKRLDDEHFGPKGPLGENGITVGHAKVFDNRTLTLLLESLADTLKGLQVIDQDPLKKALGLLQGSQTRDVSRSFLLNAGASPGVVSTQDASLQSDVETKADASRSKDSEGKSTSLEALIDRTLSEKLGNTVQTTTAARNPSAPSLPDLLSTPTGAPAFGQNAADLFTDQVNLTYQILNVRMLLERSLSDRLLDNGDPRLQVVLGFNVAIDPPKGSEDSAAVVEITIKDKDGNPVSLVSLMPQEKTYNSMAVSTTANAFGGGVVAGMFSIGYSERRRGQIFYLYRDNDTLSFERMLTKDNALTFGWQFRPVLNRRSVSSGMRQMFAVISMPVSDRRDENALKSLSVSVRTYWRKYSKGTMTSTDKKNATEARWVKNAGEETVPVPTTTRYQKKLEPQIKKIAWTRIDDKTALISVEGENFFSGTSVAMGGTATASGVIIKSNHALDIVTPIENIGQGTPMLIGRYGVAQTLATTRECTPMDPVGTVIRPALGGYREVRVPLSCPIENIEPLVAFINGKSVPGIPQLLKARNNTTMVIIQVPTSLLPKDQGNLTVVSPFSGPFRLDVPIYDRAYELKRSEGDKRTLLYVTRIDAINFKSTTAFGAAAETRWKAEYKGTELKPEFPDDRLMRFELPADADGTIALFEPLDSGAGYAVYLLDIPPAKPTPKAAIKSADGTSLVVNQNDAPKLDFTGERIGDVATVRVEGRTPFRAEYDADKKVLSVYVPQDATKLAAKLIVQFADAGGKLIATQTLEIKPVAKTKPETKAGQKP